MAWIPLSSATSSYSLPPKITKQTIHQISTGHIWSISSCICTFKGWGWVGLVILKPKANLSSTGNGRPTGTELGKRPFVSISCFNMPGRSSHWVECQYDQHDDKNENSWEEIKKFAKSLFYITESTSHNTTQSEATQWMFSLSLLENIQLLRHPIWGVGVGVWLIMMYDNNRRGGLMVKLGMKHIKRGKF